MLPTRLNFNSWKDHNCSSDSKSSSNTSPDAVDAWHHFSQARTLCLARIQHHCDCHQQTRCEFNCLFVCLLFWLYHKWIKIILIVNISLTVLFKKNGGGRHGSGKTNRNHKRWGMSWNSSRYMCVCVSFISFPRFYFFFAPSICNVASWSCIARFRLCTPRKGGFENKFWKLQIDTPPNKQECCLYSWLFFFVRMLPSPELAFASVFLNCGALDILLVMISFLVFSSFSWVQHQHVFIFARTEQLSQHSFCCARTLALC